MVEFVAVLSSDQEQIDFIFKAIKSAGGKILFLELEEKFFKRFNFTCFALCNKIAAVEYKRDGFKVCCLKNNHIFIENFL